MVIWILFQMLFAIPVLLGPLGETLNQIAVAELDGGFSFGKWSHRFKHGGLYNDTKHH